MATLVSSPNEALPEDQGRLALPSMEIDPRWNFSAAKEKGIGVVNNSGSVYE